MRIVFTLVLACVLQLTVSAQQTQEPPETATGAVVPHAKTRMAAAYARAEKESKKVFVQFHASWCTWCHKMDASMNDIACRDFFASNFVIVHLVVDESKDKKQLETPGADSMRAVYNGAGQGIPFWLLLDSKGNLISDSRLRKPGLANDLGENTGCPATEEEVDFWIAALKKAVAVSAEQEAKIRVRFRKNEVK